MVKGFNTHTALLMLRSTILRIHKCWDQICPKSYFEETKHDFFVPDLVNVQFEVINLDKVTFSIYVLECICVL